ncbi:hypothetical protein AVEN_45421-1 [Araneus ventricosus]|uniref:Uncharacterized protein n=1 Tax=Araneus ventricosus TaxID=182803 RepID=A0A4Y2UAC3_ARAVE|nr:hypothetical protein AVEN_45421-1 [Araneus ventricosus]
MRLCNLEVKETRQTYLRAVGARKKEHLTRAATTKQGLRNHQSTCLKETIKPLKQGMNYRPPAERREELSVLLQNEKPRAATKENLKDFSLYDQRITHEKPQVLWEALPTQVKGTLLITQDVPPPKETEPPP